MCIYTEVLAKDSNYSKSRSGGFMNSFEIAQWAKDEDLYIVLDHLHHFRLVDKSHNTITRSTSPVTAENWKNYSWAARNMQVSVEDFSALGAEAETKAETKAEVPTPEPVL